MSGAFASFSGPTMRIVCSKLTCVLRRNLALSLFACTILKPQPYNRSMRQSQPTAQAVLNTVRGALNAFAHTYAGPINPNTDAPDSMPPSIRAILFSRFQCSRVMMH